MHEHVGDEQPGLPHHLARVHGEGGEHPLVNRLQLRNAEDCSQPVGGDREQEEGDGGPEDDRDDAVVMPAVGEVEGESLRFGVDFSRLRHLPYFLVLLEKCLQ